MYKSKNNCTFVGVKTNNNINKKMTSVLKGVLQMSLIFFNMKSHKSVFQVNVSSNWYIWELVTSNLTVTLNGASYATVLVECEQVPWLMRHVNIITAYKHCGNLLQSSITFFPFLSLTFSHSFLSPLGLISEGPDCGLSTEHTLENTLENQT